MTTKEIAERAGVAEGSIFYHYKDRGGLLVAVYTNALQSMAEYRRPIPESTDLRETLSVFIDTLEQYLERAMVVLFSAQADTELRAALHEHINVNDIGAHHGLELIGSYLADLQAAGRVRTDIDARAATFLLLSSCLSRVTQPRLMGHDRGLISRDAVLDTFLTMIRP